MSQPKAQYDVPGIPFRNDSGLDIPAFGCLYVTGEVEIGGIIHKKVIQPGLTFYTDIIFNGEGVVPAANGFGLGYRGSDVRAAYDTSGTPVAGETWGPKPSSFLLWKGFPGILIQDIWDSTNKVATTRDLPITQLLCKTTGAVSASSSTTSYRIYGGTFGTETDLGFTTVPPAICRVAVSSGKWCLLTLVGSGWEMSPLECP